MKAENIPELFYFVVLNVLAFLSDGNNDPAQNKISHAAKIREILQYIKWFVVCVRNTVIQTFIYINKTASNVNNNILGIGSNAGKLYDHIDTQYFRSRAGW